MDTRLLRAFLAVAEELNFRKAAEKLGITQPPLTRMIAQLEAELDGPLLVRSTRSVELTGAGLHLFKRGKDLLEQMSLLEKEVRTLKPSRNGKLFLSLDFGALHTALPRLISSFKEQFPNISIHLIETAQSSITRNLQSAKIDLYFGANVFQNPFLKQINVQSQELGLLIPKENILSLKKLIQLKELNGETLIFHGKHEHLGFQEEFLEYLLNKNIRPKIYYKKNHESCGLLTQKGKGLLLTTKKSVKKNPGTVFVPLADFSPKLKIYATWSTDNPSIPLKAFLNFLESHSSIPSSDMDGHLT